MDAPDRGISPQPDIESIRSKLDLFDEYVNILKGMYSTRFNGRSSDKDIHDQIDSIPDGLVSVLITCLQVCHPNNIRLPKETT